MGSVYINVRFGSHEATPNDFTRVIPFDTDFVQEAITPIDYACPDAGIEAMFCTTPAIKALTKNQRGRIADMVRAAFLEALSSQDTLMGYPKDKE